jgi:hypothetical protein
MIMDLCNNNTIYILLVYINYTSIFTFDYKPFNITQKNNTIYLLINYNNEDIIINNYYSEFVIKNTIIYLLFIILVIHFIFNNNIFIILVIHFIYNIFLKTLFYKIYN